MYTRNRFAPKRWLSTLLLAVLLGLSCKNGPSEGTDSETHFLMVCDGSCPTGLECLCGVCTRSCTQSSSCSGLRSQASCESNCSVEPSFKICDVTCTIDADCGTLGANFHCSAGRCRAEATSGTGGAAGTPATAAAGNDANPSSAATGGSPSSSAGTAGSQAAGAQGTLACRATPDPTPVLQPTTSFDPNAVARAAAVLGSCWGDDGADRNTVHLWSANQSAPRTYFNTATQLACLANGNCGCSALQACLGWLGPNVTTSCSPGCSGSTFVACGADYDIADGYQYSMDCSRIGLSCDNTFSCIAEPAAQCDTASFTAGCEADSRPVYCKSGLRGRNVVAHGPNCSALGLDCSGGQCVGRGAACTGQSSVQPESVEYTGMACSGNQLTACVNGRTTSVDCATQGPGFACQSTGGTYFCGLADQCVPADNYSASPSHRPSCSGTALTFCNAGRLDSIDCTTLGFAGCEYNSSIGDFGCV